MNQSVDSFQDGPQSQPQDPTTQDTIKGSKGNAKDRPPEDDRAHNYGHLIQWFRQATPYINQHRDKTFVIMLSGEAVEHDNVINIVHDIALLNSLGIRIVLVHGIRPQLNAKLKRLGIKSQFVNDLRVSDRSVLEASIESCSLARSLLEKRLSMGLPNSPMHGAKVKVASGNVITAKPAGIIDGTDLKHTGLVRKIDAAAINTLLDLDNVVLLSPLGYSPTGETFSLSYEHVASEIATALNADKLIAFSNSDGIFDHSGRLHREIRPSEAKQYLAKKQEHDEFWRSTNAAINAVENGVPRAHIMNYTTDGALLQELFTVDGTGTLILSATFEITRQANREDVPAIIDIISPLEKQGILLRRDRDKLENEINHFTVIEREGLIIAIAALYPYPDDNVGEIACIATHPDYRNHSRGAQLLKHIERDARRQNLHSVFVLTTQTSHWFIENSFTEGDLSCLPGKKQSLYNFHRNSKVLQKKL